jgi:hypothetical protein
MSLVNLNAYKTIKGAYAKVGRNPVTTASVLRLMVPVTANKTSYTFPVLQGDAQTNYTEAVYLNRADAFTATSVGVFLGGLVAAGTSASTTNDYQLMSFQTETLTGAGVTNANSLFMHSYLNIAVNNVQYLQNFDLFRGYNAPIVQTGNLFASGGDLTAPNSVNGNQGFSPLTPTLQLSGTAKIDISINLPTALAFTTAPVINLIFRGFLSLGASNLNK